MHNRIVLKLDHEEKVTPSGLVLTPMVQGVPDQGVVVSVGPGKTLQDGTLLPHNISVGDEVIFEKNFAHGVTIDEVEYVWVDADNVIAVLGA